MAPRYDKQAVLDAAAAYGHVRLLEQLGIPGDSLDGEHHPCPKCGGTDRFRLLDEKTGGVFCNQCFNKKNGDLIAAVRWMLGVEFWPAVAWIAERVGVAPSARKSRQEADPAEDLKFQPWDDAIARLACVHRDPIVPDAFLAAGARLADYKGLPVVAIPVRRSADESEKPVGWALLHGMGGESRLPKFDKSGKLIDQVKVKLTFGSKAGWLGPIERVASAAVVWKCEGVSDMLALNAFLPADHVAISNANGSEENPRPELLRLLESKTVVVLHDADRPGEEGAGKWFDALKTVAAETRRARLPYPIDAPKVDAKTGQGRPKDVRDFLCERNGQASGDLLSLFEAAERHVRPAGEAVYPTPPVFEADDDPHRLARTLLAEPEFLGGPVRRWREDWYVWQDGAWRRRSDDEFRPRVNLAIKREFDRLHVEKLAKKDDVEPVQKVTLSIVSNVLQAMAGQCGIADSIEWGTWLPEPKDEPRHWIAMANGILKIDRLMEDEDAEFDDVLVPYSPDWWSSIRLPYAFDPDAECPKWEAFLDRNLEGDQERIAIVQEFLGLMLIPKTSLHAFMILEGEGANGKSVICAVAEALAGAGNVSHVPLESFAERFALTPTLGKLANICAEIGDADKVAEAKLKAFTGGEPMTFDRKGKSPLEAMPTARCIFATNSRPRFCDRSNGLWRRIQLIPMNVQVADSERVVGMDRPAWWIERQEMPGIFRWALAGLHRLLKSGGRFTKSKIVSEALAEYRDETNPAAAFLKEECEAGPPAHSAYSNPVKSSDLYKAYCDWSERQGNRPLSAKYFGKEIRKVYPEAERRRSPHGKREWVYYGIRLIGEESQF